MLAELLSKFEHSTAAIEFMYALKHIESKLPDIKEHRDAMIDELVAHLQNLKSK